MEVSIAEDLDWLSNFDRLPVRQMVSWSSLGSEIFEGQTHTFYPSAEEDAYGIHFLNSGLQESFGIFSLSAYILIKNKICQL